jgi:hypothetical protein
MFLLTALLIPRIISGSWGFSQAFWGWSNVSYLWACLVKVSCERSRDLRRQDIDYRIQK